MYAYIVHTNAYKLRIMHILCEYLKLRVIAACMCKKYNVRKHNGSLNLKRE